MSIYTLSLLITSNSQAENYVEDAKQYLAKGETQAAIIQLKNQLKLNSKDANARFLLGTTYFNIGEYLQAEKELAKASEIEPDNAQINLAYAELLLVKRNFKKLRSVLSKPYSEVQNESQRMAYLGYTYLNEKQLVDAKIKFNHSNQKKKNNLAFNGLVKIALFEKKYDLAAQLIKKSLLVDNDNIVALQLKAKLFNVQKEHAKALEIYNHLIEKDKKNTQLYAERIQTYIALGQFENADDDIVTALKLFPGNLQINYLFAQTSLLQKDFKSAQQASQKIFNVKQTHAPSMLILGLSNFGLQNFNQADKYLTQYLSLHPENVSVQNILANVYISQRKPELALLIIQGLDDDVVNSNVSLLLTLGSAYLLSGELKQGMQILNKAQALDPENKEIKKRLVVGQLRTGDTNQAIVNLENIANSESATRQYKYLLIVTYIQQKKLEKAEAKLNLMLQEDDNDTGLHNLRAILKKLQGKTQQATESYNKALSIDAEYIPAYAGLAEIALQNNKVSDAKKYFEKIILIKKDYIKAYIALASLAEKENNLKQFEKYILDAFRNASDVSSKVKMATLVSKLYAKQNQPDKVMILAKELNRQYPEDISAISFSAGAQIANNQVEKAQSSLEQIIAARPSDTNHRILLANLLSKQKGKDEDVIRLLNEVSELEPDNVKSYTMKTLYLIKLKKYEQALQGATQLADKFPEQAIGQKLQGDIYLSLKQYEPALKAYQASYKIKADNKILFYIVDLMRVQNRSEEGLAFLLSESDKNSKNIGIHFKLANIYQQQKHLEKAVEHYHKMLQIQEDNVLALNNLAGIYLQRGDSAALQLAKKAYDQSPKSIPIIDTYGYIQIKMGDIDMGLRLLEKAVASSPESYDIIFHLAEGYSLKGNKEKAKKLLESILLENVNFAEKGQAQAVYNKL